MNNLLIPFYIKSFIFKFFTIIIQILLKYLLLVLLLSVVHTGCNKSSTEESVLAEGKELNIETKINNGLLVCQLYDTNLPKEIYHLNPHRLKVGFSFTYFKTGSLFQISTWEQGEKEGKEWVYSPGGHLTATHQYKTGLINGNSFTYLEQTLQSQQFRKDGKLLYEASYKEGEKYSNKLYPVFIEEFFFEDKYYAKIKFPLAYRGLLQTKIKGQGSPFINQLEDNTFQLVINNALDLNAYELQFTYHPAQQDTLVSSTYSIKHAIYAIN